MGAVGQGLQPPAFEKFGPFGSQVASVDASMVPPGHAAKTLNARVERGTIKSRAGWRQVGSALGGFEANYGFDYCQGYDGTGAFVEAYIAIEKSGGVVKAYEVNPSSGARNVITDGVSPLSLATGDWQTVTLNGVTYSFKTGAPVYKHTLGQLTTWDALDAPRPGDPSTGPTTAFDLVEDLGTATAGAAGDWTGVVGADLSVTTGTVAFNSVAGGALLLNFSNGATSPAANFRFKVKFFADRDYSAVSRIDLEITSTAWKDAGHNYNQAMRLVYAAVIDALQYLDVWLYNSVGTSIKMVVASTLSYNTSTGADKCTVQLTFPSGYTPGDWTLTRHVEFAFRTNTTLYAGVPSWVGTISAMTPNTAGSSSPTIGSTNYRLRFGVEYYDSKRDVGSLNVAAGTWFKMEPTRRWWDDAGATLLGNVVTLAAAASPDAWVDKAAFYVQFEDDNTWRLVGTADDGTGTLDVEYDYLTLRGLQSRQDRPANPVGSPSCACAFGGWMVWGFDKGETNVRMSGYGNPGRLYRSATDRASDPNRGGDYTLADNFSDAPKWMGKVGGTLVVLGSQSAYTWSGQASYSQVGFRRVAGSLGVLGRAACVTRSDRGLPAVAWIGTDQELYMLEVDGYGGADQFLMTELSRDNRGDIRATLTQTDNPDTTLLWMGYDERTDSVRIRYGAREIGYRRSALLQEGRPWEPYSYAGGPWVRLSVTARWGVRMVRSTGQLDEFERNSAANFAEITGANRDGGNAMPAGFYTTRANRGDMRQWFSVFAFRSDYTKAVAMTVTSDGVSHPLTVAAHARQGRCALDQKGYEHQISVTVDENTPEVYELWVEIKPTAQRPIG